VENGKPKKILLELQKTRNQALIDIYKLANYARKDGFVDEFAYLKDIVKYSDLHEDCNNSSEEHCIYNQDKNLMSSASRFKDWTYNG